jgi:hypothetical protein
MRYAALCAVVVTALAGAFAGRSAADAAARTSAARVVDRTLLCRVGYSNGARLVFLTARSAARRGDALDWLAHATVATAGNPLSRQNSQPTLAGVSAGWPPPPPLTAGALAYDNARCGATRMNVPLSPKELSGNVASAFGEDLRCIVGKTVLVRVRAVFRGPVTEDPNKAGDFVTASGRVVVGRIAVRTPAGRPVAYADVTDGGRARLFVKGCG